LAADRRVTTSMTTTITASAHVRVTPRNELVRQRCHAVHYLAGVPLEGAIGMVDRVDGRHGDHSVVVVFDLWCHGTRCMDSFRPEEPELITGLA
jgi:hypothetical protein